VNNRINVFTGAGHAVCILIVTCRDMHKLVLQPHTLHFDWHITREDEGMSINNTIITYVFYYCNIRLH
jgi:hypothetical protein